MAATLADRGRWDLDGPMRVKCPKGRMLRRAGDGTGSMRNTSRGLRETVIRAMAKVGLVWALVVLGALFMTMSAQSAARAGGYSLEAMALTAQSAAVSVASDDGPRTEGLALALVVLAGGVMVLAVGASRAERVRAAPHAPSRSPISDLPLALGFGLLA